MVVLMLMMVMPSLLKMMVELMLKMMAWILR